MPETTPDPVRRAAVDLRLLANARRPKPPIQIGITDETARAFAELLDDVANGEDPEFIARSAEAAARAYLGEVDHV